MSDIRFIVPFGSGGASDRAARNFARSIETGAAPRRIGSAASTALPGAPLRLTLTIENHPGAGGRFGVARANELARAGVPVLLLGTPTTHILLRDREGEAAAPDAAFRALIGLGSAPNVLLVSPRLGIRSVGELIACAMQQRLVYASAGAGQTIHVVTALFCRQAGIRMTHQPYDDGSATAYGDLISGRVHVYFDNLLGCRDMVTQGHAVPLAVSEALRNHLLPEVPTLAESGIRWHAPDVWLGAFGAHCRDTLADRVERALRDATFADELRALGLSGGPLGHEAMAARVAASAPSWRHALAAGDEERVRMHDS